MAEGPLELGNELGPMQADYMLEDQFGIGFNHEESGQRHQVYSLGEPDENGENGVLSKRVR